MNSFPVGIGGLCSIVNVEPFASHYTALAPASCDDGSVARFAPRGCEDSLCDEHPADGFGTGFAPDEDHLLPAAHHGFSLFRAEHSLSHRRSGPTIYTRGPFPLCHITP